MNKKLLIVLTIILSLAFSSIAFAVPAAQIDQYSVVIKVLDVYNSDDGKWYRLNARVQGVSGNPNQGVDLVYVTNVGSQNWFRSATLVPGNYSKFRLVIEPRVSFRAGYHDGVDQYYTNRNTSNLTQKPIPTLPADIGDSIIFYDMTAADIANMDSKFSSFSGGKTRVSTVDVANYGSVVRPFGSAQYITVDPTDIEIMFTRDLKLTAGNPVTLRVNWTIAPALDLSNPVGGIMSLNSVTFPNVQIQ